MLGGLSIGVSGLLAAQRGMDVAAHNLANVNTPGYARQRLHLTEAPPTVGNRPGKGPGTYGTGVVIRGIEVLQDDLLNQTVRSQLGELGAANLAADLANQVDEVLGPMEGGIADDFSRFWAAWDSVSVQPELLGARNAVIEAGRDLASGLRAGRQAIDSIVNQAGARMRDEIDVVNGLAHQIASLNVQITEVNAQGGVAGDLMNERNRIVEQLSQMVGATVRPAAAASIDVIVQGGTLVSGSGVSELATTGNPPRTTWKNSGATVSVGGSIGATEAALNGGLDDLTDRLDLIATGVRDALNALHTTGFDLDGNAGLAFFTGTTAANFEVNTALNARSIVASKSGAAADGNQALAIADLRNGVIIADPVDPLTPQQSTRDAVANLIGEVGRRAAAATRAADSASQTMVQLDNRRAQISGVTTDEELTDLIRFQRAYEASARVINVMDQALDLLVNRLGLVGR